MKINKKYLEPMQHNQLTDIQGGARDNNGKVTEAVHLTREDYDKTQTLLNYYSDIMDLLARS